MKLLFLFFISVLSIDWKVPIQFTYQTDFVPLPENATFVPQGFSMKAQLFTGYAKLGNPLMFGLNLTLYNKNGWKDGHVYLTYAQFEKTSSEKNFDNLVCTQIYDGEFYDMEFRLNYSCGTDLLDQINRDITYDQFQGNGAQECGNPWSIVEYLTYFGYDKNNTEPVPQDELEEVKMMTPLERKRREKEKQLEKEKIILYNSTHCVFFRPFDINYEPDAISTIQVGQGVQFYIGFKEFESKNAKGWIRSAVTPVKLEWMAQSATTVVVNLSIFLAVLIYV